MLERAMDLLAGELGMDPIEVRRRNLLAPNEFPYRTPTGAYYDSGNYARALDHAVELAGLADLRAEQAARRGAGGSRQLGIGVSTFVEISGSGSEYGAVTLGADGTIVLTTGAAPHGQGHETTLSQIVADVFAVPLDRVEVVHSDTDRVARGTGTFGSRTGQLAGSAARRAAEAVVELARRQAADVMEAALEDIVPANGGLAVAGVPARAMSWGALAATAPGRALQAEDDFDQEDGTYPFGAHLALVEVDVETGKVTLERLVAVDDCGTIVNPMIVAGQVHGGLAQGAAQALFEEVRFDATGNPQNATLADYGMPSAAELPSFQLGETVTPSPRNPLGMKGVGESGSVGATAAIQNAVVDALQPLGVRHVDMPLTPERVWRAIRDAGS
jgi:aerobic carbon-monoxide dehydrogenase large subunit